MARAGTTGARAAPARKRASGLKRGAAQRPSRAPKAPAGKTGQTSRPGRAAPHGVRGAAGPAPKVSKDELRAQIERLARANATLRARNKELRRAAGEAADRIAQLESELARRQGRAAQPAVSRGGRRARRQPAVGAPDRDPGDAVPSGVAVQEPQPLSEADQKVLEHLNEELAPE